MIDPRPGTVLNVLNMLALLTLLSGASAAQAQDATTATDVCPANADPCVVSEPVKVAPATILDFGTRAVSVVGKGAFEFAGGTSRIRCGSFDADSDGPAIRTHVPAGTTPPTSRSVHIEARRRCDGGDGQLLCLDGEDCQLGACGTRRCSGNPVKTCTDDSACQIGPCGPSGRCLSSLTFVRCSTNADCDFGTCPVQATCRTLSQPGTAVDCSVDADCAFGACTLGDGNLRLSGGVAGAGRPATGLALQAADSVTVTAPVNLKGRGADEDGGELFATAGAGDVMVAAPVNLRSGKLSRGGALILIAARDVAVEGRISAEGGDFDGGIVDLESGRDIHVGASLLLNSRSGAGFGGIFQATAGGDVTIDGGPAGKRVRIEMNGHRSRDSFPGDGGDFDVKLGGSFTLAEEVRVSLDGAPMGSYGGFFYVEADGDLVIDGDVQARGRGARESGGGDIDIFADGFIHIGPESTLSTDGDDGFVGLWAEGDLLLEGTMLVDGGSQSETGDAAILSRGNLTITGQVLVLGGDGTTTDGIDVDACRIALAPGSLLLNRGVQARTHLLARESMTLLAGSSVKSKGTNLFSYRAETKPPLLQGEVSPVPQLLHHPALTGCPVCGNNEIDEDETCDDGNTTPGDGCSEVCLTE